MNTTLRITIDDLTEEELKKLANESRVLRIDPRKPWSEKEYKEHARYAIIQLLEAHIGRDGILKVKDTF